MKIKNVYFEIFSMQNLYQAYLEARRGRRYKPEVLKFGYDIWESLRALREEVLSGKYEIEEYFKFYIHEPKERLIMSIAFRHRVVQWAIYLVVNPLLVNGYIKDSYGCIPGRGPLKAMKRLSGWLEHVNRKNERWFYLKLDISKYFYRIPHKAIEEVLRKKIKDERLMKVLTSIINCEHTPFGLPAGKSPGDEMIFETGMPIGNLLSQMFANVYLNELDQFCKRTLSIKYYIRYMDDIIILADDKAKLHEWQMAIKIFLKEKLQLDLNKKTCIRPINQGIEFIGYRLWPNRAYLRKSTTLGMKRGLKGVMAKYREKEMTLERATQTFRSYIGLLKHTDSDALTAALHQRMILSHEGG